MNGQGSSGCCLCATLAMAKRKSQGPPRTSYKTWHPCRRRVTLGPPTLMNQSTLPTAALRVQHYLRPPQSRPTAFQAGGIGKKQAPSPGTPTGTGSRNSNEAGPIGG